MTFLPMGSKYCNTDGRSVLNTKGFILKNKPYLVPFYESMNFSADPHINRKIIQ